MDIAHLRRVKAALMIQQWTLYNKDGVLRSGHPKDSWALHTIKDKAMATLKTPQ